MSSQTVSHSTAENCQLYWSHHFGHVLTQILGLSVGRLHMSWDRTGMVQGIRLVHPLMPTVTIWVQL